MIGLTPTSSAEQGCGSSPNAQGMGQTLPPGCGTSQEQEQCPGSGREGDGCWHPLSAAGHPTEVTMQLLAIFQTFGSQINYQNFIGLWQNQPGLAQEQNWSKPRAWLTSDTALSLFFCALHHFFENKTARWPFWTRFSADCYRRGQLLLPTCFVFALFPISEGK